MDTSCGSLVIVGSGIKFMAHLSVETMAYINQSDKVLYSVNEPAMESWIKKNGSNAESLDLFESNDRLRADVYREMTHHIVKNVKKPQHVCVIFYGHPTIFAQSALDAVLMIKQEGYFTKILPGISAEDCLFADLCIDPGSHGCQSYEATDFLIRERPISTVSHLILWQIGMIGALKKLSGHNNKPGLQLLLNYLKNTYPHNHPIFSYEAALYPHTEPKIGRFILNQLTEIEFSPLSTLYIPPLNQAKINLNILAALNMQLCDLRSIS
jgi:tetrapyrrole methylase family protein / MazG family protein